MRWKGAGRDSAGRVVVFVLLLLSVAAGRGQAQLPPVPVQMAELDFLLGDWAGSGWIELAPGQRNEFQGTERVERRLGGRLVVVEGDFSAWFGPDRGMVPVHHALGLLSWDAMEGSFVFRTYTAQALHTGAQPAEVADGELVWGYVDPSFGTVRFTITVTPDGEWLETGRVSPDGGRSWHTFFEMRLVRQ